MAPSVPKKKAAKPKTKKPAAKKPAPAKKKSTPGRGYVNSEQELANFLVCSRATISRLKRKPGCPVKTADGKYPMAQWKEFYEAQKDNFSVDDQALAGERKARQDLAEVKLRREIFELEKEQGRYMDVDEVCKIITQAWSGAVQHLKDSQHTLAPLVAGMDVPEARGLIRKNHIEALQKFSLGEWAKKKVFWSTVYAQLQDLQATYSHGNGLSAT